MEKIIIDGEGAVLGRLGTFVAKALLKGDVVEIINSEKVIVSGDKKTLIKKIQEKRDMGRGASLKGPKYIRQEDRLLKRMLRGMLPRNKARGREAFKNLKCYIGSKESSSEDGKVIKLEYKKPFRYSTMKEIVSLLKSRGKKDE